jgi:hypothetical protein
MSMLFILFLFLFFGVGSFLLHNRFNNTFGIVLVSFFLLCGSYLLIDTQQSFLVLFGGILIGLITDFLGVYTRRWKYHTKDGYNYWIGFAWGFVTLVIYQLRALSIPWLVLLLIAASAILVKKKNNLPRTTFEWIFTVLKVIGIILYPAIFVLSLTLGIIIEYLAVEVFRSWHYANVSYLIVGMGYTTIVISVVYAAQYLTTSAPLWQGVFMAVLYGLYVLQYALDIYRQRKMKIGKLSEALAQ